MRAKQKQNSISFVGKYELTVLSDFRIILPADVMRQLKLYDIKKLLPGRIPDTKALVLCPETLWSMWISKLKKNFPCLENHKGARSFLIPWQPIGWDSKGRISLPRRARDLIGIKSDQTAIILGNDYCFELWSEENFDKITRECEAFLQRSSQYLLPTEKDVTLK